MVLACFLISAKILSFLDALKFFSTWSAAWISCDVGGLMLFGLVFIFRVLLLMLNFFLFFSVQKFVGCLCHDFGIFLVTMCDFPTSHFKLGGLYFCSYPPKLLSLELFCGSFLIVSWS